MIRDSVTWSIRATGNRQRAVQPTGPGQCSGCGEHRVLAGANSRTCSRIQPRKEENDGAAPPRGWGWRVTRPVAQAAGNGRAPRRAGKNRNARKNMPTRSIAKARPNSEKTELVSRAVVSKTAKVELSGHCNRESPAYRSARRNQSYSIMPRGRAFCEPRSAHNPNRNSDRGSQNYWSAAEHRRESPARK